MPGVTSWIDFAEKFWAIKEQSSQPTSEEEPFVHKYAARKECIALLETLGNVKTVPADGSVSISTATAAIACMDFIAANYVDTEESSDALPILRDSFSLATSLLEYATGVSGGTSNPISAFRSIVAWWSSPKVLAWESLRDTDVADDSPALDETTLLSGPPGSFTDFSRVFKLRRRSLLPLLLLSTIHLRANTVANRGGDDASWRSAFADLTISASIAAAAQHCAVRGDAANTDSIVAPNAAPDATAAFVADEAAIAGASLPMAALTRISSRAMGAWRDADATVTTGPCMLVGSVPRDVVSLDEHVTTTGFLLAQVIANISDDGATPAVAASAVDPANVPRAPKFVEMTLWRQVALGLAFDPVDWIDNVTSMASIADNDARYADALHCLMAATAVWRKASELPPMGAAPGAESDPALAFVHPWTVQCGDVAAGEDKKREVWALICAAMGRHLLSRLQFYRRVMLGHEEAATANRALLAGTAAGETPEEPAAALGKTLVFELRGVPPPRDCIESPLTIAACGTVGAIRAAARDIGARAISLLNSAASVFQLDGFVSTHVELMHDLARVHSALLKFDFTTAELDMECERLAPRGVDNADQAGAATAAAAIAAADGAAGDGTVEDPAAFAKLEAACTARRIAATHLIRSGLYAHIVGHVSRQHYANIVMQCLYNATDAAVAAYDSLLAIDGAGVPNAIKPAAAVVSDLHNRTVGRWDQFIGLLSAQPKSKHSAAMIGSLACLLPPAIPPYEKDPDERPTLESVGINVDSFAQALIVSARMRSRGPHSTIAQHVQGSVDSLKRYRYLIDFAKRLPADKKAELQETLSVAESYCEMLPARIDQLAALARRTSGDSKLEI